MSHAAAGAALCSFLVSFFVRPGGRFFGPTCACSQTARAAAVKAGRRCAAAASSAFARPRLDGGEHGVTLRAVGTSATGSSIRLLAEAQNRTTRVLPNPDNSKTVGCSCRPAFERPKTPGKVARRIGRAEKLSSRGLRVYPSAGVCIADFGGGPARARELHFRGSGRTAWEHEPECGSRACLSHGGLGSIDLAGVSDQSRQEN
jgi:hypothetical protein